MRDITYFLLASLSALIVTPNSAHGQDSLQVGIKLGTGIIRSSNFQEFSFAPDPRHIIVFLSIPGSKNFRFDFSVGFGFSKYTYDEDYDQSNPYSFGADRISKSSIIGFPIEAEAIFGSNVSKYSPARLFCGIGIGYYHYKSTIRINQANLPTWDEEEQILTGLAQYFTAGFGIKINSHFDTSIQFKQIGFNLLKSKADLLDPEQRKVGEKKSDIRALSGFSDVGILFGLTFIL